MAKQGHAQKVQQKAEVTLLDLEVMKVMATMAKLRNVPSLGKKVLIPMGPEVIMVIMEMKGATITMGMEEIMVMKVAMELKMDMEMEVIMKMEVTMELEETEIKEDLAPADKAMVNKKRKRYARSHTSNIRVEREFSIHIAMEVELSGD